jgi:hypothetical protein
MLGIKNEKTIRLNFSLALKRAKKDMRRDEWFLDPLQYKDILDVKKIKGYFKNRIENYSGSESEQYNLPKPGFMLRYAIQISIYDRILYQAIIDQLIELYDPLFSKKSYSHRLKPGHKDDIFYNGIDAWKRFRNDVNSEMASGRVLLVADVQNFYEYIDINILEKTFNSISPSIAKKMAIYIELLNKLLRKWSPYKGIGIPQNQDPSSFLGNLYLHPVDKEMLSKGYNYFRYMDDIRIVCDNEYHARLALKHLIVKLRTLRMNVNPKKTKILDPIKDPKAYFEEMPPPNRQMEEIDALFKARRLTSLQKALPKLRKFTLAIIKQGKTADKEFRFCTYRLEKVARCKEVKFDFSQIKRPVINLLLLQPWSTNEVVKILRSIKLNHKDVEEIISFFSDEHKNIYGWQAYLVWQLLAIIAKKRRRKNRKLTALARKTIKERRNWTAPMKAGAILYLGACGTKDDELNLLKHVRNLESRMELRAITIATNRATMKQIEKYVHPYVSNDVRNEYDYLKSSKIGSDYFEPLPDLDARELYDDLPGIYF